MDPHGAKRDFFGIGDHYLRHLKRNADRKSGLQPQLMRPGNVAIIV